MCHGDKPPPPHPKLLAGHAAARPDNDPSASTTSPSSSSQVVKDGAFRVLPEVPEALEVPDALEVPEALEVPGEQRMTMTMRLLRGSQTPGVRASKRRKTLTPVCWVPSMQPSMSERQKAAAPMRKTSTPITGAKGVHTCEHAFHQLPRQTLAHGALMFGDRTHEEG